MYVVTGCCSVPVFDEISAGWSVLSILEYLTFPVPKVVIHIHLHLHNDINTELNTILH